MIKFNHKKLEGRGIVATVDTMEGGYAFIEAFDSMKSVDAKGIIKVNGDTVPNAFFNLDTDEATLSAMEFSEKLLDLEKIYVEVNIWGDVDLE